MTEPLVDLSGDRIEPCSLNLFEVRARLGLRTRPGPGELLLKSCKFFLLRGEVVRGARLQAVPLPCGPDVRRCRDRTERDLELGIRPLPFEKLVGCHPVGEALILLDPPYGKSFVPRALAALRDAGWIAPAALIAAEFSRDDPPTVPGFEELATREHGAARLVFLRAPG